MFLAGLRGARATAGGWSRAFVLIISTSAAWAGAQAADLRIEFPDEGSREVWAAPGLPTSAPFEPVRADTKSIDFSLDKADPKDKVFIWDRKTGNLAYKPVAESGKVWKVKAADFTLIGLVRVRVEHRGLPVAAAHVVLKDKRRTQTQMLDDLAGGVTEFYGVTPGQVVILTTYRAGEKTPPPLKQIADLSLKRDNPDPEFAVAVVEVVSTAKPTGSDSGASPADEKDKAAAPKPTNDALSLLIKTVITLVILAAGFYGVYRLILWLNKNPKAMQDQLQKLGVQVPDPAPDAGATPPAAPAAPAPPEKIILTDAPTPTAAAPAPSPAPTVAAPQVATNPKLVRENGQVFNVPEGVAVVSREDGQAVSLVGEDSVSRRHAEIHRSGSVITVKDLGSTNGTYVNGVKLVGELTLNPGDTVQFGTVRLRFEG